jgi:hypothetical protein
MQQTQEDERRALKMFHRQGVNNEDEFFDNLGKNDAVYRKLRSDLGTRSRDDDMDELL